MVTDDEVIYDQTFTLNLLESPNNPQKKSYLLYKLFKINKKINTKFTTVG